MAVRFWVKREGKEYGPTTRERLYDLAEAGKIRPSDLVRRSDSDEWTRADCIPSLFPTGPVLLPSAPQAQPLGSIGSHSSGGVKSRSTHAKVIIGDVETPTMERTTVMKDWRYVLVGVASALIACWSVNLCRGYFTFTWWHFRIYILPQILLCISGGQGRYQFRGRAEGGRWGLMTVAGLEYWPWQLCWKGGGRHGVHLMDK